MAIDVVLNELSFLPPASDEHSARQRMSTLVLTLIQARSEGIRGELRVPGNLYTAELAPGYFVRDWTSDRQAERDERNYFLRLATKIPFLQDIPDVATLALGYDFKIGAEAVEGCGVAYLLNAMLVSFYSDSRWETTQLEFTVIQLADDGNLLEATEKIIHACAPEHVQSHRHWIQQRLQSDIRSGADLWTQKETVFPSLGFCDCVEEQIRELERGTPMLQPVVAALFNLAEASRTWTTAGFDPKTIQGNVSPESAVTMQRFGEQRRFRCPDGEIRDFDWHLKIALNAWRIHFCWENAQPGRLLIGYIGKHLPTVNDPT